MAIFWTKMTRRITVNIFSIEVSAMLYQSLNHAEVSSQACDMKGCTEVVCPGVHLCSEFDEDFDQRSMPFTWCQMKWSKPIRIGAIDDFEHFIILIEILLRKREDLDDLGAVTLIYLCPIVHLDLLDILLTIFLLLGLLVLAWWAFDWTAYLCVYLWCWIGVSASLWLGRSAGASSWSKIRATFAETSRCTALLLLMAVVGEFICLLIIVIISNVNINVVLWILATVCSVWRALGAGIPTRHVAHLQAGRLNWIWWIFTMVEILFWVPAFTKTWRGASTHVRSVLPLIVLRKYLW